MVYFRKFLVSMVNLGMVAGLIWLFLPVSCKKKNQVVNISVSSNFITKKDSVDNTSYGCVRIRRGDILRLTGRISFLKGSNPVKTILTTKESRIFIILPGKVALANINDVVTIKGKVIFEGNKERLPELKLTAIEKGL